MKTANMIAAISSQLTREVEIARVQHFLLVPVSFELASYSYSTLTQNSHCKYIIFFILIGKNEKIILTLYPPKRS